VSGWKQLLLETDLDAHEAAEDPHSVYQKESEKDEANGYVGLDGDGAATLDEIKEKTLDAGVIVDTSKIKDWLFYPDPVNNPNMRVGKVGTLFYFSFDAENFILYASTIGKWHFFTGATSQMEVSDGLIDAKGNPIQNVEDPTNVQDAATKNYVDKGGTLNPSSLTSDHTAIGAKATLTAGTALVFGEACYIGGDSKMEKTDADAEATSRCFAMALATIAENASGTFLLCGFVRDDSWDWAPGGYVYLDTETAGGLTQTAPNGTDDCIVIVGKAYTAHVMYFDPTMIIVGHL